MLKLLAKLFGTKKPEQAEAPYKIETPTTFSEQATTAVVESIKPVATKPVATKPAVKKPAAPKKSTPRKSKPKA